MEVNIKKKCGSVFSFELPDGFDETTEFVLNGRCLSFHCKGQKPISVNLDTGEVKDLPLNA
jgi:hypothetical protein